ncbi:hypothetical protein BDZ94DRAFT_1315017 [Collybia nuda]|uniref:CxC2-like cysteine cluster KDZ transposase-associated domain-containing protein n=1 Tax=Collybia nuda TaxID=64659 RepID=A0A9P6C905_9AGAR|nr:hypothetical protein BDZ94DRAFT_1315017 [Collybia nuda]
MKDTTKKQKKMRNRKAVLGDTWRHHSEEQDFLKYLGPYYSRAKLDTRLEEFLTEAFLIWLDRFPLVVAPDAEADYVQWLCDCAKKRFSSKMHGVGAFFIKKPAPVWDCEITLTADRTRRRTEFLAAERWGIRLESHQYKVAAEEKGLRNHTIEELEQDFVDAFEKDMILKCLSHALLVIPLWLQYITGRKRQRGLDATFYVAPDSPPHDNELPLSKPPIVQRHTTYNSTGDSMSSARSYYNMPVSPQKVSEAALTLAKDGDVFENAGSHNNRLYPHTEIDNGTLPHNWMDPNHIPSCSEGTTDISTDISGQQVKQARTVATDHPLHIWTLEINVFVHELLRLEGLGGQDATTCSRCSGYAAPVYHCSDCLGKSQFFGTDAFGDSTGTGMDGRIFSKGLRVQLGHVHGESCSNPLPASKSGFVVIDTEKIHTISLDFCNCHVAMDRHIQLLRARLYPATTICPQTAATFRVLEGFQLLSFMSKVSAFEFYYTIARRTDNTGVSKIPDRYSAFLRMIREWRHIKTLKRMGRACPHPGKNLPPDWKDAPAGRSWLYTLFVGIDANFRLSRFNVSSNEHDPGLNHGYAFFVEDKKFKAHLKAYGDIIIDEVSTCNNHDAVKSASLRGGKGIDASGAGTVECSRHDMKRPISFGDLQKGERHVNIDYLFLNTLTQNVPHRIVVSYDVACIWSPNLLARSQIYPPNLIPFTNLIYVVPKFHLPAHISKCQANFSLNFTPWVGRTDGEAPERGWAAMNAVATSTREMGPGSRRNTLDDHFGDYNWRKITSMVTTFHNKFKEAVNHRSKSVAEFQAFSASLPPDETAAWTLLIQAWEKDPSQTNPLEATLRDITVPKVRLQLAEDDAKHLQDNSSGASVIHTELSPSMLIIQGIEIEDLQHSLRQGTAALSLHPTSLQKAKLLERNNRLQRRIDAWISFQQLYTPGVAALRRQHDQ